MFQEVAARGRQPNAARQAHEKLRAQLRFELLDVPGQRGLGDPDLVGRARDASFIGDLHEILDAAQFHERQALRAACDPTITNRHVELELRRPAPRADATFGTIRWMPKQYA